MGKKFIFEEVQFNEDLYKKNLEENDFSGSETDGIGSDEKCK